MVIIGEPYIRQEESHTSIRLVDGELIRDQYPQPTNDTLRNTHFESASANRRLPKRKQRQDRFLITKLHAGVIPQRTGANRRRHGLLPPKAPSCDNRELQNLSRYACSPLSRRHDDV